MERAKTALHPASFFFGRKRRKNIQKGASTKTYPPPHNPFFHMFVVPVSPHGIDGLVDGAKDAKGVGAEGREKRKKENDKEARYVNVYSVSPPRR